MAKKRKMQIRPGSMDGSVRALKPATAGEDGGRTVEVVWSTGAGVLRSDAYGGHYVEELDLSRDAVDLGRLRNGAPFLLGHRSDPSSVIGVVMSADIEDGTNGQRGVARIQLSNRDDVEPLWRDISDGILRQVSIGYSVSKFEEHEQPGTDVKRMVAKRWQPYEISLVAIGADAGATFRNDESATFEADVMNTRKGDDVTVKSKADAATKPADTDKPAVDLDAVRAAAIADERTRTAEIRKAVRQGGLGDEFAERLITEGVTANAARAAVLEGMADRDESTETVSRSGGADHGVSVRNAVADALAVKTMLSPEHGTSDANGLAGRGLVHLASMLLESGGVSTRGMSADAIAKRALATSDFVAIIAANSSRVLRSAYETAPSTFERWSRAGTASNFMAIERAQLSGTDLKKIPEAGELPKAGLSDAMESYRVETWGRRIALTRQAIINDDLSGLTTIPQILGRAAREKENEVVIGILTGNPTLSDGNRVFSAAHNNTQTTGTIDATNIAAARLLMRNQVDIDGKPMWVDPRYILCAPAQEADAEKVVSHLMVPNTTPTTVPESIRSLGLLVDPRVPAGTWYLMVDGGSPACNYEFATLNGQRGPTVEQSDQWSTLAVEFRAYMDFGAGAVDFRGAVRVQ